MVTKADVLLIASKIHDDVRTGVKFHKPEAVRKLAASGLFSLREIGYIVDLPFSTVEYEAGMFVDMGPNNTGRVWNISALSALHLVAKDYEEGKVNTALIRTLTEDSNSVRAVAELTGVPMDDIRRVVYGDPYLLDLLRAGSIA